MTRRTRHQLRCQCCGLLFPSMHPTAKWCSNACNQHAFRQRRKAAALVAQATVIEDPDDLPASWQVAAEPDQAPFTFDGMQLRVTTDEQGVPWFVAADVCGALGIGAEQTRRLDDDERSTTAISTPGGTQSMTTVNEPGLYSLILGSRKPEAKRFKRWVTHEVLPAIRRTGSYSLPGAPVRRPRQASLPPFRMEDLQVILSNGEPVTTTAVLPLLGLPNTRANQMALAAVLRQLGYTKLRVRRTGRRMEWVFFPPGWQSCARPALPPAGPCIVIQASSYREAAQAWAEALEGAAVGAIRRRFSTVSRPGNLLPAGVHFMPLQA
jgi:hypothetical protein